MENFTSYLTNAPNLLNQKVTEEQCGAMHLSQILHCPPAVSFPASLLLCYFLSTTSPVPLEDTPSAAFPWFLQAALLPWEPSIHFRLRWQHNGAADGQVSENNQARYEKQSLKRKHLEKPEIKESHFLGSPRRCSAMTDDMTVILTPYSPMLKLFMGNKHHVKNRLPDTK